MPLPSFTFLTLLTAFFSLRAESADDDYTLAPHVEVRPPVAQGSGAPRHGVLGVLSVALVAVLAGR